MKKIEKNFCGHCEEHEVRRSNPFSIKLDCFPHATLWVAMTLCLTLIPVQAAQEQALVLNPGNGEALQVPVKVEENKNPNIRQVAIKNEFYESIKLTMESNDPSAEIKSKEIYLNPYQTKNDVSISKKVDYKIKIYNVHGAYLGYLINTETRTSPTINISPFLLVQDLKKQVNPIVLTPRAEDSRTEPAKTETKVEAKTPAEKFLKVTNLTNASYKLNIILPSGETVDKTWDIDDDSYIPEFLDLDSKHYAVKPEYKIVITDKKSKTETSKLISELNIDEQGNYTWIIGDQK